MFTLSDIGIPRANYARRGVCVRRRVQRASSAFVCVCVCVRVCVSNLMYECSGLWEISF